MQGISLLLHHIIKVKLFNAYRSIKNKYASMISPKIIGKSFILFLTTNYRMQYFPSKMSKIETKCNITTKIKQHDSPYYASYFRDPYLEKKQYKRPQKTNTLKKTTLKARLSGASGGCEAVRRRRGCQSWRKEEDGVRKAYQDNSSIKRI